MIFQSCFDQLMALVCTACFDAENNQVRSHLFWKIYTKETMRNDRPCRIYSYFISFTLILPQVDKIINGISICKARRVKKLGRTCQNNEILRFIFLYLSTTTLTTESPNG